jgi:hypothetical protein
LIVDSNGIKTVFNGLKTRIAQAIGIVFLNKGNLLRIQRNARTMAVGNIIVPAFKGTAATGAFFTYCMRVLHVHLFLISDF